MEKNNIKVSILPNQKYLKDNGTFDKDASLNLSGKIAGVCYDKEGFKHLENEPIEKTNRRINMTLNNGHHSVYDHINISFNIGNIPKILAMVLNNEKQYTTSEKSARYTPVVRKDNSIITDKEELLYNTWLEIFKIKIKDKYGNFYNDSKIQKLAQENARYLVTVFMPTEMIYTTTLRQINYIASWMEEYINKASEEFEIKLSKYMKEFIKELDNLNILDARLMKNEKDRSLSLFGTNIISNPEYFGNVYSTVYKGTYAELAQAQRHRTIDYQIERLNTNEFYIPPIILDDKALVEEWLADINDVKDICPQGELVSISEMGKYEDFILKCKERLCTHAQLEIAMQTRDTLLKYRDYLKRTNHILSKDITKYTKGARCTFPDYKCLNDCKFIEGKILTRRI